MKPRDNSLLRHPLLNGWPLFGGIAGLSFAIILAGLATIGTSTPEATVAMIRLSVQLASPWVYLAFVATALVQLFPSSFSTWLLRNRRYVGLSFAAGFGWQAVFIAVLLGLHGDYYATALHDTGEFVTRMLSYALLLALTVTSFFPFVEPWIPDIGDSCIGLGFGISGRQSGCLTLRRSWWAIPG